MVGYNVQIAVDTAHHLIITHEVTNVGTDRSQLSTVAKAAKTTLDVENLDAVADRGYFSSEEILACENAGITVTLPKPMTSNSKAEGRFGKQDFRYVAEEDVAAGSTPAKALAAVLAGSRPGRTPPTRSPRQRPPWPSWRYLDVTPAGGSEH